MTRAAYDNLAQPAINYDTWRPGELGCETTDQCLVPGETELDMSNERAAKVITPLGDKVLLLHTMMGREALGRPFRYELEMLSEDGAIDFSQLMGEVMTVQLNVPGQAVRELSGHVRQFSQSGVRGRHFVYRAQLGPWFELLAYNSNCRIFQEMSVPDVVKAVFSEQKVSDFEDQLKDTYRTWTYLVQYRESDFQFVSRLLEQEGIYYYFKHEGEKHTLVLVDEVSSHSVRAGAEKLPYYSRQPKDQRAEPHFDSWEITCRVRPGKSASVDYDFIRPRLALGAEKKSTEAHAGSEYEVFDYPGEYPSSPAGGAAEGAKVAQLMLEQQQLQGQVIRATGNVRALAVGDLFKLAGFYREDQNKEHMVVSSNFSLVLDDYESSMEVSSAPVFRGSVTALNSSIPFRSERTTLKPTVEGPQTAVVVGASGEEIHTDEYGRVKIQFHWDREGNNDEASSCWVRVSQAWAGASFGGIYIPRIGQEVVVSFLEGDPDRPLITGRVYNFENMPPYELPANKTQSGFKTQSASGGTLANFNELRFEDKIGAEQVFVQAEKDLDVLVKDAETRSVGTSRSEQVGTHDSLSVGKNRSAAVGLNDSLAVGVNQSVAVGAHREVTSASESISTGQRTKLVNTSETTSIGTSRSESVGASESITISKDQSVSVGGARDHSVGKNDTLTISGKYMLSVEQDTQMVVGKKLVISAGDQLSLECGDASIVLKKNGEISIKGKNVDLKGSSKINLKASSTITLKGSKVNSN